MSAVAFNGLFNGLDNNGVIVPYGRLYFTECCTGKVMTTFTDSLLTAENTNPVILSASGKAEVYLLDAVYDITLKDSNDVVIWTMNNYIPAGGTGDTLPSGYTEQYTEEFTGIDSSTLTLSVVPVSDIQVHKNGLLLPSDEYSLFSDTVTFVTPLISGDTTVVGYIGMSSTSPAKVIYSVDVVDDLSLLDTNKIVTASVKGYDEPNDGGGGIFNYDASQSGVNNKGTIINGWVRQYNGNINVLYFGVKGDGLTDDTDAINDALNAFGQYTAFYFPQGEYLVSSTINIRNSYTAIIGDGSGATSIIRTDGDYGDTFSVSPDDPTSSFLLGITFHGIKIRANVEMNSDAHLHLEEITQSTFTDVFLEDGFRGLLIEGGRNIHFSSFKIESGKYFNTLKAGSAFTLVKPSPNTAQENTEIGFFGFNWTFTINATIEYGLIVNECDGMWFDNGHILGGATGECLINFAGGKQLTGLRFDNIWFDGHTDTNVILSNAAISAGKNIDFNGCTFSGSDSYCVSATSSGVFAGANFSGCSFEDSNGAGVRILSGTQWSFTGCTFTDIDRLNTANAFAIYCSDVAVVNSISVSGCTIGKDATLDYGVRILNPLTEFTVTGNSFTGIAVNEVDLSPTDELKGTVSGNRTDRSGYNEVATSASLTVPAVSEVVTVTGAESTILNIYPRWDGREITLRPETTTQTISNAGGNIITQTAADVAVYQNRAISLKYIAAGDSFYQNG